MERDTLRFHDVLKNMHRAGLSVAELLRVTLDDVLPDYYAAESLRRASLDAEALSRITKDDVLMAA